MKVEKENDKEKSVDNELLDELLKSHTVTRAIKKLNEKPLEVSVYRYTSAVEALEQELTLTSDAIAKTKEENVLGHLQKRKQFCEEELAKHENEKIEGVMTQLTFRDMFDVKAAITEAALSFKKHNFDAEVQMVRMAAEERYMTVFCALKKKDDLTKQYFGTLNDIALADDITIAELYLKWEKHFILTDDELKN